MPKATYDYDNNNLFEDLTTVTALYSSPIRTFPILFSDKNTGYFDRSVLLQYMPLIRDLILLKETESSDEIFPVDCTLDEFIKVYKSVNNSDLSPNMFVIKPSRYITLLLYFNIRMETISLILSRRPVFSGEDEDWSSLPNVPEIEEEVSKYFTIDYTKCNNLNLHKASAKKTVVKKRPSVPTSPYNVWDGDR